MLINFVTGKQEEAISNTEKGEDHRANLPNVALDTNRQGYI